jgi:ribosomal protein S12 methylthiotransferase accessory factor
MYGGTSVETVAPYCRLGAVAVAPDEFALYRPEQYAQPGFPYRPFTVDTPVAWTAGRSLLSGEVRLVPAAMACGDRSDSIAPSTDAGLAYGDSFGEAALAGLCDAIWRDAAAITWQARVAWPRVRPDSLPPLPRELFRRFVRAGVDVDIVNATTDLDCPTMMTVALGDAAAVAVASHPCPETALVNSLTELADSRKQPLAYGEFLWSSMDWIDLADVPALDGGPEVLERVGRQGYDVIAVDQGSRVRIVVPGLHPLFFGHRYRALGGHRLYRVPQLFGARGLRPGQADNPYPHPFT